MARMIENFRTGRAFICVAIIDVLQEERKPDEIHCRKYTQIPLKISASKHFDLAREGEYTTHRLVTVGEAVENIIH
jgi:hypothetical protein